MKLKASQRRAITRELGRQRCPSCNGFGLELAQSLSPSTRLCWCGATVNIEVTFGQRTMLCGTKTTAALTLSCA